MSELRKDELLYPPGRGEDNGIGADSTSTEGVVVPELQPPRRRGRPPKTGGDQAKAKRVKAFARRTQRATEKAGACCECHRKMIALLEEIAYQRMNHSIERHVFLERVYNIK